MVCIVVICLALQKGDIFVGVDMVHLHIQLAPITTKAVLQM